MALLPEHTYAENVELPEGRVQKSLVLVIVVIPFLATGVAIWQLWERYVTWLDIALLVGVDAPISSG